MVVSNVVKSTAVCTLFLDLPDIPEGQLHVHPWHRDAHFFVSIYLFDWQEHKRVRVNQEGVFYRALPWYREKTVCHRVAQEVRAEANRSIRRESGLYTVDDKRQIWQLIKTSIDVEAANEYGSYIDTLKHAERGPGDPHLE